MTEENISQEFGLKNIDEVRNYFNKQKNQNELMSKKHKNVCRVLNYMKQLLILVYTITGCCFYSAFASLVGIPAGVASSAVGLNTSVITAGIKKHKSVIKKNKKNHDKIVLFTKSK